MKRSPEGRRRGDGRAFRLLAAGVFLVLSTAGCGLVLNYSNLDFYYPPSISPSGTVRPDDLADLADRNPQAAVDALLGLMIRNTDPLAAGLGRALAKLPDVGDGVDQVEFAAMKAVYDRALAAGEAERRVLWFMARENPGSNQYSGSLQGLFWYARKRGLQPGVLLDIDPAAFLEYAWRELPKRLTTPALALGYLTSNFAYRLNRRSAYDRATFFRLKYGDCTEFTLLAGYLLSLQGLETHVLLTRPTSIFGHASVVYVDEDGLWLMDASRATLAEILKKKKAREELDRIDRRVWQEVEGFDRIIGPAGTVEELLKVYEAKRGEPIPYRLVSYEEYQAYVEEHGQEAQVWWDF